MDVKQIRQLRPLLNAYLRQFDDCFARCEPVAHLRTYVAGQLSDLHRKTMEPIADSAGLRPRNLQHFLSRQGGFPIRRLAIPYGWMRARTRRAH